HLPSEDTKLVDSKDVDGRLKNASHVLKATYRYPYQAHGSIGSSCAVADVQADRATIWSPTQSVYPTRACVALLTGLPAEKLSVIFVGGSGCYGLNADEAASFDAALLSQAVRGPVRVQFTRQDEFVSENYGSVCVIEEQAGLDANGGIDVWDCQAWSVS